MATRCVNSKCCNAQSFAAAFDIQAYDYIEFNLTIVQCNIFVSIEKAVKVGDPRSEILRSEFRARLSLAMAHYNLAR